MHLFSCFSKGKGKFLSCFWVKKPFFKHSFKDGLPGSPNIMGGLKKYAFMGLELAY